MKIINHRERKELSTKDSENFLRDLRVEPS
jgi:hypothetical protein